ncbi:MAG: Methionine biosynthesis protein MetW [Methanobacterium sp. Maddingley MBC34]|nr:MAG: Methionine biosynthesis protein MetW [Methanobacterium sp. Maddingley MBC34]
MSNNFFSPSHNKIIGLIGKNKRVLDVGCSEGCLSKRLRLNGCEVFGIEINKNAAQLAKSYCQEVFVGDVESIKLNSKYENFFDCIVFADVLEHLKEPAVVLRSFKEYLKADGQLILSVPNIAHWSMRLKLLFGNFEYKDQGLLDRGHLRFFNEKSVKKILLENGFEISTFDINFAESLKYNNILHLIGIMKPNFFGFQFLIVANKKRS